MEHGASDASARAVWDDGRCEHVALVAFEIADRRWKELVGNAERAREDLAFVPVALSVARREPPGDELVPPQRCEDERRLDPQEQLGLLRAVVLSIHRLATHRDVT